MESDQLMSLTADIVSAHVSNNSVAVGDVGNLVQRVHEALSAIGDAPAAQKIPVVSIRASLQPDFIVCMECGNKQKMLRRHLRTAHGMTPEQYRKDYGLPDTYPMTSPNYSKQRSSLAQASWLGRKEAGDAAQETPKAATKKRGRKPDQS